MSRKLPKKPTCNHGYKKYISNKIKVRRHRGATFGRQRYRAVQSSAEFAQAQYYVILRSGQAASHVSF